MNKTLLTVLALSCTMTANVAAQEYKGSAPVSGATYNLYNVARSSFSALRTDASYSEEKRWTLRFLPSTTPTHQDSSALHHLTEHGMPTSTAHLLSKRTSSASGASSPSTARRTFTP